MVLLTAEDVSLCVNEVVKLVAVLRTTERYSDITKPSILWPREVLAHVPSSEPIMSVPSNTSTPGTSSAASSTSPLGSFVMPSAEAATSINTVAQLVDLHQNLSPKSDVLQVLTPFMHVVVDPSLSGYVTAAALVSTHNLVTYGSRACFLGNKQMVGGIIDCVTQTRFTETNRDHDETVLLRIVSLIELILTQGAVDKTRIATGLQCVQTIWIQETHSAALKDSARSAVSKILLHVMSLPDGCEGYASTLVENVCLNMELLGRQPAGLFDVEKLSFFVDIISRINHQHHDVPFQLMHALHCLLPPGPAAALVDGGSLGILTRNTQALPLTASLLSIGNSLVRSSSSALVLEALLSSMYCRSLCPARDAGGGLKLAGLGELALDLLTSSKKNLAVAPNGYITLVQSAAIASQLAPHTQQIQAMLLESLAQLFKQTPDLVATLWETFDSVWHRSELASQLLDGLVHMALSNKVIALLAAPEAAVDRERVQKALGSFFALATSPESLIDPDALVPSYIECLAVDVLKEVVLSLQSTVVDCDEAEDYTPQQFLTRSAARDVAKQTKNKPKKTGEIVVRFIDEFHSHVGRVSGLKKEEVAEKIAWGLRVIPSMDFDGIGEFFGQPSEVAAQTLSAFIRSLDLQKMDPEEALRACLQSFRLPGEAQQIDRIVKEIAYEFYKAHAASSGEHYFASADAAYTFLFSVIMLNTDQHNPQVKRRMELKDFLRNNRKINDGQDIPEEVQTRVFNSIRNSQIVTPKSGSFFCAPLKGRWKDLCHLHKTGYISDNLNRPKRSSVPRLLAAKGYDLMLAAAYVLARDPKGYTRSIDVIAGLADLCLGRTAADKIVDPIVRSLGADCVAVLRRYALKSFATNSSNIVPTPRSYACVSALLRLEVGASADPLLESVGAMLCYWAPYEALLHSLNDTPLWPRDSSLNLENIWEQVLAVPLADAGDGGGSSLSGAAGGGISYLFRGFLNASPDQVLENNSVEKNDKDWRKEVIRSSFSENSPTCPSTPQLMALKGIQVETFLQHSVMADGSKVSAIVLMMSELITGTGKGSVAAQDFWEKELIRSSPWALLLAVRILTGSRHSDLLAASAARDAVITILRHYGSGQLTDPRGLKITVFVSFLLVTFFAQKDPSSNVVDPAWLLPVLDEVTSLGSGPYAAALISIGPTVARAIQAMLSEAPPEWRSQLGAPVWRECVKVLAAVSPKGKPMPAPVLSADENNKLIHQVALELILSPCLLASFSLAANGANDMADCIIAYEQILCRLPEKTISKTLAEIACQLAGLGSGMVGAGLAWAAVVARITFRVSAVAKQRKPTGPELSDSVELLRICLGHPTAHQILSPTQAGTTIEKCASTLSAVVSAYTPGNALQAALSVFTRFFLTCLDKLQKHPQFDHLWLMSLRVILLFIKRGHDDPSLEQLAEITTETLRNALQVLVATSLLQLPPLPSAESCEPPVVWWKVTWEIVETFCPGIWTELRDHLEAETQQPSVEVVGEIAEPKVE